MRRDVPCCDSLLLLLSHGRRQVEGVRLARWSGNTTRDKPAPEKRNLADVG